MKRAGIFRGSSLIGLGRWLRWVTAAGGAATFGTLAVTSCDGGSEPVGSAAQRIGNATEDPGGPTAKFPAVARVQIGGGGCTGTLVSDRVVLTAAHCINTIAGFANGCASYAYLPAPDTGITVWFPPAGSSDVFAAGADVYGVDGISWHPGYTRQLVSECCGGDPNPATCALCGPIETPDGGPKWDPAVRLHDIAVLHLDRPVASVAPMPALLRIGPQNPALGTFPVDPLTLIDEVGHVVGTSSTTQHPAGANRAFGPMYVTSTASSQAISTSCDVGVPGNVDIACDQCRVNLGSAPNALLPDGGACPVKGDSGGPFVLNHTSLGATPVDGLPASQPFVVAAAGSSKGNIENEGCTTGAGTTSGYTSTWDSDDPELGLTNHGTFILAHLDDFDGDGVLDIYDNCQVTPNPGQENCNEDAEVARNYPKLGDACDPIACPGAELKEATAIVVAELDNSFIHSVFGRAILNRVTVQPLGSQPLANGSNGGQLRPLVPVPDVLTDYRFCQKDSSVPIDCGAGLNDGFLNTPEGPPSALRPYHKAHLVIDAPSPPPSFEQETLTYDSATFVDRRWEFQEDHDLWVAKGWINPVGGCGALFGCGTGLDGRFWIHAQTTKGQAFDQVGTGYRVRNDGTPGGAGLHNHYHFLEPDGFFTSSQGKPLMRKPPYFKWLWVLDLPRPPTWDGLIRESSQLLELEGGHYGLLRRDGRAEIVDSQLGSELTGLMATPSLVWASAVEPRLNIGPDGAQGGFHAAIFAADGSDVINGVLRTSTLCGTTRDLNVPQITRAGGPAPRALFGAVFSRAEDRAFVIGGVDARSGILSGDLWMRAVSGPMPWTRVDTGKYVPQRVLSATWSFFDRRLWILDQLTDSTVETVRLSRVDPYLGVAEVVYTWPWTGRFESQWLEVDLDGQVLLISSSQAKDAHSVARFHVTPFDSHAPVTIERFQALSGALSFPPLVDLVGYTFVRDDPAGRQLVVGRRPTLGGSALPLDNLANVL